jgi:hypothetical protein
MAAENARRFEVTAPGRSAWAFVLAFGALLPLTLAGVLFAIRPDLQAIRSALFGMPLFPVVAGMMALTMQRRSVAIEHHQLVVRAAFYTLRLPLEAIELQGARVISLAEHTGMKPWLKTNAMSLPGFHAGHYRARDKRRLFALLTDDARVLSLPEHGGRTVLLSLRRPQALLAAIEDARRPARDEARPPIRRA